MGKSLARGDQAGEVLRPWELTSPPCLTSHCLDLRQDHCIVAAQEGLHCCNEAPVQFAQDFSAPFMGSCLPDF